MPVERPPSLAGRDEPLRSLPRPVLVVGGYGYRNVGDEAILAGLLARLGTSDVTVVSHDPVETRRLHGVSAVGLPHAVPALGSHASVVIGGGGLFGADMGRIGRLLPVYAAIAVAGRRHVVIEGVDVDPRGALAMRLLRQVMRRACRVSVRDEASAALLRRWGVTCEVTPDLSAWMPPAALAEGEALLLRAGVNLERPIVGLALTGMRPQLADQVVEAACAAVDALPGVAFCVVPMARHPRVPLHDDLRLALRIAAASPRVRVVHEIAHPSVYLSAFRRLSAVVGMRYHAMLFAARSGVPLVPVAYAEKNRRWLAERGLEAVAPQPEALIEALGTALARRPVTHANLERAAS